MARRRRTFVPGHFRGGLPRNVSKFPKIVLLTFQAGLLYYKRTFNEADRNRVLNPMCNPTTQTGNLRTLQMDAENADRRERRFFDSLSRFLPDLPGICGENYWDFLLWRRWLLPIAAIWPLRSTLRRSLWTVSPS